MQFSSKILLFFCLFILFVINLNAQIDTNKYQYKLKIQEAFGDLNKNGIEDKVVVNQDTLFDEQPYKLQIYFKDSLSKFKLITSTTKLIEPKFKLNSGKTQNGVIFSGITIAKGILIVSVELLRGHYEHKFRYQNGNFELIGFSTVSSNGIGYLESTDFNLSTGIRIIKKGKIEDDKMKIIYKGKILLRPLPKLQDIVPYETEYY